MIIETIISTTNSNNEVNFAPFGIRKKNNFIFISPYIPSRTLDNLISNKCAVINYTNNPNHFVNCLIGKKKFQKLKSFDIPGYYLKDCLSHDEVRVISVSNDKIRPTFKCKILGQFIHKRFDGFNRAQASIIEACILASRLRILKKEKIKRELLNLSISIEKTAGKNENKAWENIKNYIYKTLNEK